MIKYHCPACQQKLGVPDNYAGHRIRCNKCNQPSVVPRAVTDIPAKSSSSAQPAASASVQSQAKIVSSAVSAPAAPVAPQVSEPPVLDEMELVLEDEPRQSNKAEELHLIEEPVGKNTIEYDPNLEAIKEANRQRAVNTIPAPQQSPQGSGRRAVEGKELLVGMGKIPLSLAACAAAMTGVILIWVVVGMITGFEFWFIVMMVPVAGAWGLTVFTRHRGVMLGLLAVVLGFVGMIGGRAAVARWVIMPMLEKNEEFIAQRESLLGGGNSGAAFSPEELDEYVRDEDQMLFIAAQDLVDKGQLDADLLEQMSDYEPSEIDDTVPENIRSGFYKAADHLDLWSDAQKKQVVQKQFEAEIQANPQDVPSQEKVRTAATFIAAFLCSFRFLDLVLFPMSLFGAYKLAAGADE